VTEALFLQRLESGSHWAISKPGEPSPSDPVRDSDLDRVWLDWLDHYLK